MRILLAILLPATLVAQDVRPVPPPGIEIPAADRAEIEAGVKKLGEEIAKLRELGKPNAVIGRELPNVEIFHKSADWALRYGEIFDAKQIAIAKEHILQGLDRAAAIAQTKDPARLPWNTATGLVARGYRSKIDGSVQPYGLLIPESYEPVAEQLPVPLHFWCHGRNEKLSELAFINGVQNKKGEFTPDGAIVCYLYGRFCNANKFAGERDLFEALEDIKAHYKIDDNKLVVRGFSMGGAACWQFAFHFPGMWAAAAPGAGFAETEEFFRGTLYAEGATPPPWWERHLWRWYDNTIIARNIIGLPLVAYSGEMDKQKQAADIMVRYAAQEGRAFTHVIGPDTPHKYHPAAKPVIEKFVEVAVGNRRHDDYGRPEVPKSVSYTTYSLIYPKRAWVTIKGLEKSWERADIEAAIEKNTVTVKTRNVSGLRLTIPVNAFPEDAHPSLVADGAAIGGLGVGGGTTANGVFDKQIYAADLEKIDGKWTRPRLNAAQIVERNNPLRTQTQLAKSPELCGPIDHAFMSKFIFVRPTGKPLNDAIGKWTQAEMEHAIKSWRAVFRGDVTMLTDQEALALTERTNATNPYSLSNFVLWGDISSNAYIKRVAALVSSTPESDLFMGNTPKPVSPLLPIVWGKNELNFKAYRLDPARYVPVMIYPNPLNPSRYVVLNSGHTFREFALLNNSDQTPKLPDWAIVDITTPPGPKWPGLIYDAGFFDEQWK
jgi:pimeloyl-ACP methyl ester carboxylesterase